MKNELDKKISEQPLEKAISEFENWLIEHPDEKHVAIKLKKLKENIL